MWWKSQPLTVSNNTKCVIGAPCEIKKEEVHKKEEKIKYTETLSDFWMLSYILYISEELDPINNK